MSNSFTLIEKNKNKKRKKKKEKQQQQRQDMYSFIHSGGIIIMRKRTNEYNEIHWHLFFSSFLFLQVREKQRIIERER
jgi:hypothetical protein